MANRKSGKSKKSESKAQEKRTPEQMMRDLSHMLSQQDFESAEDVNRFLQQQLAGGQQPPPAPPMTDLDRAQNLIYEAHEARTKAQTVKLARKALEVSADCADGYVMLAELNAKVLPEALALYEAGVKAGERALGDEFDELKGHFWGFIETRPYMRARQGVATTLWEMGRLAEAASHMDAMLELNPNDNQGIRYLYITLLLELDDLKRLEKLLQQYPGDWSAYWKYGQALYHFKKSGRSDEADDLLSDAIFYNSHVPPYLIGKKRLPKNPSPGYYSPGDENEAVGYVRDGIRPWQNTNGAVAWLKEIVDELDEASGLV